MFDLHRTLQKYLRIILNDFEALTNLVNRPIIFTHHARKEVSIWTLQYAVLDQILISTEQNSSLLTSPDN